MRVSYAERRGELKRYAGMVTALRPPCPHAALLIEFGQQPFDRHLELGISRR